MTTTPPPTAAPSSGLAHFPIVLFATVMGTAGLAIAWLKAVEVSGLPASVGITLRALATLLFIFLCLAYGAKLLRHPCEVRKDFTHPVKLNFFPAISIGLLLLAVCWMDAAPGLAQWMWTIGAIAHIIFTMSAMSSWINHPRYEITHATPAWFIPVVGNVIVPIAGMSLGHTELSWFFFAVGIVFWLVLLAIILYRLFFHEALPARLQPTLFILIAPPAAAFLAYLALTDTVDVFARVLYFSALFLTFLLSINSARLLRMPFAISAWSTSFPLAAITIATLEMQARTEVLFYGLLSSTLLTVVTILIGALAVKTLRSARRGEICLPE